MTKDPITELVALLAAIDAQNTEMRRRRATLVQQLRDDGWSLQRIADAIGRTKQTVDQWVRPE